MQALRWGRRVQLGAPGGTWSRARLVPPVPRANVAASANTVCGVSSLSAGRVDIGALRPPPGRHAHSAASAIDPFALVADDMDSMTEDLKQLLSTSGEHPVLETVATYFFEHGGKRFRPVVLLLIARATAVHATGVSAVTPGQQRVAEIAEMIHTASLLHDDVIDESDTRRGVRSVNAAFGNKIAVLAGDFLLARSSMALARLRNCDVVELLSLVIEELVEGELLQIRVGAGDDNVEPMQLMNTYLRKNYLKTGSLIANAARAEAMLGGHDNEICDAAYAYGRHLGMAFQLIDDALDFRSAEEALGKPALADMRLGLATAPVLLSLEQFPELSTLVARRCSEPGDMEQALEWVQASDGVRRTEDMAAGYGAKAVQAVACLAPSEERDALGVLMQIVLSRSK